MALLHESLPEEVRVRYAGWLHTATPAGITLAAAASFLFPWIGWRGAFWIGALPALLVFYLRRNIPEPEKWKSRIAVAAPRAADLFRKPLARSAWPAALMVACAIFGLWSTSYWAPTFVITRVVAEGGTAAAGQKMAARWRHACLLPGSRARSDRDDGRELSFSQDRSPRRCSHTDMRPGRRKALRCFLLCCRS